MKLGINLEGWLEVCRVGGCLERLCEIFGVGEGGKYVGGRFLEMCVCAN